MNKISTLVSSKFIIVLVIIGLIISNTSNAQTKKKAPVKKKTTTTAKTTTKPSPTVKKTAPIIVKSEPQPVETRKDNTPKQETKTNNQKTQKTTSKKQTASYDKTPFHKGSKTFGIGLGAGINYDYYGSISGMPAIFIVYDQGIIDKKVGPGCIGIGGMIAYKHASYRYGYGGYKASWSNFILGVRGTWHLNILAKKNIKFDPYGGVMFGFRYESYRDTYYSSNSSYYDPYDDNYKELYPIAGAFVGAKYNFKPNIGAFAEIGYDITFFRAGINFNF